MKYTQPAKSAFRLAVPHDLEPILRLQCADALGQRGVPRCASRTGNQLTAFWRETILDRSVLVAEANGQMQVAGALDLDHRELAELYVRNGAASEAWFVEGVAHLERLALRFGILDLSLIASPRASAAFLARGYRNDVTNPVPDVGLKRSLRRRLDRFARFILELSEELGIPPDYGSRHRMACQPEATRLRSIGMDIHGREQFLAPQASAAWKRLHRDAMRDGVELQAVSAFRSASYQAELVRRKLSRGLSISEILHVSAAPGYSEHHSGRAIDITTPGFAALEEEFESSPAYEWLQLRAPALGFRLSFPRHNRHGLVYEPWHWYFEGWRAGRSQ